MDSQVLTSPLADIRVLQIGTRLAGRLLTRLLTDQGASAVVVDLADPSARAVATAACADCDIVVDAGSDGQTDAAGLGFDELSRERPTVIYCSLPVYPAETVTADPDVDEDVQIAAELGLNHVAGRQPRDEELPSGSAFGAFMAAGYAIAALLHRDRDPAPQHIVVPLAAATLTTVARRLIRAVDKELVDPVSGPRLPIASRYECSDGRFIQSGGAYSRFVETLIDVIDRPEWRESAIDALYGLPTAADEAMWRERFDRVFLERTAAEWERDINAAGGSCTKCRTRDEWLAEPYAHDAEIVVAVDGVSRAGRAVRVFESVSGEPTATATPQRAAPADNGTGGPLRGIVVIDLSIVLAGPTCGRALSDLGADVIKVDDPHRPISPYGWLEVNRGKRSILLDLRRDEGREVLWRLISGADVLIENYRHGKLDQLGFGFGDVARARPGIVYASLNAFDVGGSWQARPGWEHNAQAATGMQLALAGWGPGRPPDQVTYPLNDFGTGLLGAYGIMLALGQRNLTGKAQFVAGSLARTATFIQSPLFEEAASARRTSAIEWLRCRDGFIGLLPGAPCDGTTETAQPRRSTSSPTRRRATMRRRASARRVSPASLFEARPSCRISRGC